MSLEAGRTHGDTVNVTSNQSPPLARIAPGDPDDSYLVRKVEGTGLGARMPRNMPPLSGAEIQLIRDWVSSGAPDN